MTHLHFLFREERIHKRLHEISTYTIEELIAAIGAVYRDHYLECCRGVIWGDNTFSRSTSFSSTVLNESSSNTDASNTIYCDDVGRSDRIVQPTLTLKALQLIAVCIGTVTLTAICKALAVNYKHFSGGAPDLLLVRVLRRRRGGGGDDDAVMNNKSSNCLNNEELPKTVYDNNYNNAEWQCININDLILTDILVDDRNSNSNINTAINVQTTCVYKTQQHKLHIPVNDVDDSNTGGLADDVLLQHKNNMICVEASNIPDSFDWKIQHRHKDVMLPSMQCSCFSTSKQLLPDDSCAPLSPSSDSLDFQLQQQVCQADIRCCSKCSFEYKYEAIAVEVKGPTDHLAIRQRLWLHLLNVAGDSNIKNRPVSDLVGVSDDDDDANQYTAGSCNDSSINQSSSSTYGDEVRMDYCGVRNNIVAINDNNFAQNDYSDNNFGNLKAFVCYVREENN